MHPLPELAARAVTHFVETRQVLETPQTGFDPFIAQKAGVFVTLKTPANALRGCIGTISPVYANVLEETIYNAIAAASRDPRFPPVQPNDLSGLKYSVSVLHPPEPIQSLDLLDPAHYGVIVTARHHRGLLLPDLEGIDTPQKQVYHATLKAGLTPGEPVQLQRFRVDKYA
ncbi:MAG: AmmeMemoRadiSam system protein A [Candidatus Sericytochromatia bacterium]|nr:AmmeMemoRadiSam system protein A [Candidatus Sericytochromatia bacterium]